jgi:LPXTG-motif cell wall-anchored protein
MPVARRFAVAFAVVGIGVLAYALPASATESGYTDCITNPTPDQLAGTLDAVQGTATVHAKPGVSICSDVLLSAYKVPDTWVGSTFDKTAVPQTLIGESAVGQVEGTGTTALTVPLPGCGAVQVDLYLPPEITTVTTTTGHRGQLIKGAIFRFVDSYGKPIVCEQPTPPTTTTAPPTETTTAPPTETTTATPPETTTAPPTGTTTAAPTPTTTAAGTIAPAAPPSVSAGPVVPVPTTPAPPAPPVLASTGSNATIPLIGIGVALLGAGIGLSLVGRRRRTA